MIETHNLQFSYNQVKRCLTIGDWQVRAGSCVLLCGASGSGKSTLIRLLNGLIPEYYAGTIGGAGHCGNGRIGIDDAATFSQTVGSVFQNPATQFFHRVVRHELVFPCENQGIAATEIARRLQEVSAFFDLVPLLDADLTQLSGGQRQRVAMATAMMQQPQVLLLDEPTANLDAPGIELVRHYVRKLATAGVTIVIAEHRLHCFMDMAEVCVCLHDDRLAAVWTPAQLAALDCAQLRRFSLRQPKFTAVRQQLACKKQRFWQWQQAIPECATGLVLRDWNVGYRQLRRKDPVVLQHIAQLWLPDNVVIGISGANGTGKTTWLHQLAGLQPLGGTLLLDGHPQNKKSCLAHSSLVMQETRMQLFAATVQQELSLGVAAEQVAAYGAQLVDAFRLQHLLQAHPMTLSGGEQQRVLLAHAILANKRMMLFDEPSSGLDGEQLTLLAQQLQQLKQPNRVILVVSHDEELLASACDAVYAFDEAASL